MLFVLCITHLIFTQSNMIMVMMMKAEPFISSSSISRIKIYFPRDLYKFFETLFQKSLGKSLFQTVRKNVYQQGDHLH